MYLTRMPLDVRKRDTMRALACPNMIHGAVENSFPGERERRLWRIDCLNGQWYLLVLSEEKPDLTQAAEQFGFSDEDLHWETKDYTRLLNRIQAGDIWHFRLVANPTVSRMDGSGGRTRGKVYAHVTAEQQEDWLIKKASSCGFSLERDEFHAVHREWYHFTKGAQKAGQVSILAVTFEGALHVTDEQSFCRALVNGIGRGKAYGLGLLTVADLQAKGT